MLKYLWEKLNEGAGPQTTIEKSHMGRAVRNTLGVGILGKSGCGRKTSNNYENFAYGRRVRDSGSHHSERPGKMA